MMVANAHYLIITVKPAADEYCSFTEENDRCDNDNNSIDDLSSTTSIDENNCVHRCRSVSPIHEDDDDSNEVVDQIDMNIIDDD